MYKENPIKKKVGVQIYKEKPIEKRKNQNGKKVGYSIIFFFLTRLTFRSHFLFFFEGGQNIKS